MLAAACIHMVGAAARMAAWSLYFLHGAMCIYIPASLHVAQLVYWLRLLLLPPLDLLCIMIAWAPVDEAWHDEGHANDRGHSHPRRHHTRHHLPRVAAAQPHPQVLLHEGLQEVALAAAAAAAVIDMHMPHGGGSGRAGNRGTSSHWPPPLEVPPEVDELPPEEVPETYRCVGTPRLAAFVQCMPPFRRLWHVL